MAYFGAILQDRYPSMEPFHRVLQGDIEKMQQMAMAGHETEGPENQDCPTDNPNYVSQTHLTHFYDNNLST